MAALAAVSCSDRDPAELEVARARIEPLVFDDALGDDVYFQPFFGTHYTAASIDSVYAYRGFAPDGARSWKIEIPPLGSALGPYSGGVLTSVAARDLTDFNALSFYARASRDITLNSVGFGNDNTGNSLYDVGVANLALTTSWREYVLPIPNSARLIAERGLFLFAEGAEEDKPEGYELWFDEIRFAQIEDIALVRPQMSSAQYYLFRGSRVPVADVFSIFSRGGQFVVVDHAASYFDFLSSDGAIAEVDFRGMIHAKGAGPATITAKLGDTSVIGTLTVRTFEPPTAAAARPTAPGNEVISMFSDAYADVPVDSWRADWGGVTTVLGDYAVRGNSVKMYSSLNWVGIEFLHPPIDASAMQYLHLDLYAPAGSELEIKMVSFSPDLSTGVETDPYLVDANSTPPFAVDSWMSVDIPLADLVLPTGWDWSRIGQLVLASGDAKLVLVDNVYWHP